METGGQNHGVVPKPGSFLCLCQAPSSTPGLVTSRTHTTKMRSHAWLKRQQKAIKRNQPKEGQHGLRSGNSRVSLQGSSPECPRGDPSLRQHKLTVVCQGSSSEARPRGFIGGWPHRHHLPSTGPSPRLPERGLNCIVCRNDLGAAGFVQCRVLFTSPLPDGSPGLTPQAGPLQGLWSLACCAYYPFCTPMFHPSTNPGGSTIPDCPKSSHSPLGPSAQPQGQAAVPLSCTAALVSEL